MIFTELTDADVDALVALNDAAYPAVPITPAEGMRQLLADSDFTIAVRDNDELIGFMIGMQSGSGYQSENFSWFQHRGTDFLYVDRIVIAESRRGSGLGRELYDELFSRARAAGRAEVTCEVNLDPPNPRSLAFHARLGFVSVGTQETKNGSVTVDLLAAAL